MIFLGGMKAYTVHENRARRDVDARTLLVRDGFNWAAFAFPLVWVLHRRVWLGLAIYFGLAVLCVGLVALMGFDAESLVTAASTLLMGPAFLAGLGDPVVGALGLALAALIGWEANDVYRRWLAHRGYQVTDIVAARNLVEAERKYFDERGVPGEGSHDIPAPHPNEPILGLFSRWPRRT